MSDENDIRADVQDFILDCLAKLDPEHAIPLIETDVYRRIKNWIKTA